MDYQVQVITITVSDLDKAAVFYTQKAGFILDVDYHPAPNFRVIQLTPPGSACSIQLGLSLAGAPRASGPSVHLIVTDIKAARRELTERGVKVGPIRHKSPFDNWRGDWKAGLDPERRDYASFADFADPDGNAWVLQEIGYRNPAA